MKLLLSNILIFLSFFSLSQNVIEGYIKSHSTNEFIPYCHVFIDGTTIGVLGNDSGKFKIEIPDSLVRKNIVIKSLGYKEIIFPIDSLLGIKQVFYLTEESSKLPIFTITAKKEKKMKRKKVGATKRKTPGSYFLDNGFQVALFFPNKKKFKGYISKVKFFIKETGYPDTPFRIRVYSVDKQTGAPKKELLKSNVIASGVEGNEWVVVDLTSYSIKIPKNGFFVAMEWLPISEGREHKHKNFSNYKTSGQVLGGTFEFGKTSYTWTKSFLEPWVHSPSERHGINKTFNAKIGAELLVYKRRFRKKQEDD